MPTVLVVDDEPLALALMTQVFERDGFCVLAAGDAKEALRLFGSHGSEIDVLVSDVAMPGMRGPALAEALLAQRPDLPVLLVSGYCDTLPRAGSGRSAFLPKPFSVSALLQAVRKLIAGPAASLAGMEGAMASALDAGLTPPERGIEQSSLACPAQHACCATLRG